MKRMRIWPVGSEQICPVFMDSIQFYEPIYSISMEEKYCQSCGMPLQNQEELGSNADGSKNEEYCCYCYKDGAFTLDCTMDQMIEHCAQFVEDFNKDSAVTYAKDEAIANMKLYFPTLKRWRC